MKKWIIFIILLGLALGCNGKKGDKGDKGDKSYPDAGTPITELPLGSVDNPSGFAEAASCLKRGDINLTALDADYKQLNDYETTTTDNRGRYKIDATVTGVKARTSFRGWCARETASGTVWMSMETYHDLSDDDNQVNIPGTIQSELSQYYKDDVDHPNFDDREEALEQAKDDILAYFGFTGFQAIDFSTGSIQGDSTNDAIVTLISSIVDSRHSTGPEMNDDMSTIAYAIYTGDQALKTQLAADKSALKLKDIRDRLIGLVGSSPPIWSTDFGFPAYYTDILGRTPVEMESKNTAYTSTAGIGLSTYSLFIWPIRFTVAVGGARYIALDVDNGALSIWTKGAIVNGYETPGSKVVDLTRLNEVLLPGNMNANYDMGESHGLTTGTDYILVQEKATPSDEHSLDVGDPVPFGQNSAYDGVSWLPANVTGRFTRSIKWRIFD